MGPGPAHSLLLAPEGCGRNQTVSGTIGALRLSQAVCGRALLPSSAAGSCLWKGAGGLLVSGRHTSSGVAAPGLPLRSTFDSSRSSGSKDGLRCSPRSRQSLRQPAMGGGGERFRFKVNEERREIGARFGRPPTPDHLRPLWGAPKQLIESGKGVPLRPKPATLRSRLQKRSGPDSPRNRRFVLSR